MTAPGRIRGGDDTEEERLAAQTKKPPIGGRKKDAPANRRARRLAVQQAGHGMLHAAGRDSKIRPLKTQTPRSKAGRANHILK
jgi:hypothetical protein